MSKVKLKKSDLQLKQFVGTVIKGMDNFEGIFETKRWFEMIPIMVVTCNKDQEQLGIVMLKLETIKLTNSLKAAWKKTVFNFIGKFWLPYEC